MTTDEILLSSKDNEATSYPYWAIVKPGSFGRMVMLAGVWFNRPAAESHLESKRYNYGAKAFVYCFSGHESRHVKELYENARSLTPTAKGE